MIKANVKDLIKETYHLHDGGDGDHEIQKQRGSPLRADHG